MRVATYYAVSRWCRPWTEAARDAYREQQRSGAKDDATRTQIERALAEVEFPATLPPYDRMLVDAEDHLWVQDYLLPGHEGPTTWSVFDPEGRLLGVVELPARFQPRQIGRDFVLGVWRDELDVSYVRLYELQRG